MQKILVVDDEKNIVDIIKFNLKREGYEVITAENGREAIEKNEAQKPDLIMLDIMMPEVDGYEACRKIREKYNTPIIMLTARAEELDKVLGLELGADDYVTKPFGVRELMARVKANLRKRASVQEEKPAAPENSMVYGKLIIDLDMFEVKKGDEKVELTLREFELLKFLASAKGQVFSREALMEKVWGYEYYGDMRTVDVTVRRLREKIEDDSKNPMIIKTVRGMGYRMD